MLRDFKFLRRNSGKNEEIENIPINPRDSLLSQASTDSSSSRAPLNAIQEPELGSSRSKVQRTPTKPRTKNPDSALPLKTPDRCRAGFSSKNPNPNGSREDSNRWATSGTIGGWASMTPRDARRASRATSGYSESSSTHSTPTKSIVSKPPPLSVRSKFDGSGVMRAGVFGSVYKGMSSSSGQTTTVVNTVEVPHFDLKEDPSFWMDHNVQVLIRVRPLNSMERSTNGYSRCLKQENSQSITLVGQPETRFTFDYVACERIDQETLFRKAVLPMVENCLSGYNSCIFAYGQTGSGKTYTMLGEIDDLEVKPSPNRGMTPRIFEFLFARIQAEEESRSDEKLKYNCKCSFLEIYNEQITDLLDPSSTNLLLREDVKEGVYVENLSEYEVQSVRDILRLLSQGSLNRKVAATNMNRESSRSHSVFTCVIESRWEKDSTSNLRFARLNLVDLAGSERQKTSGAEGERLREAANINKSLSTLGHVIMILVDVANGKPRHVPYRDSRLTFLLQDSLGGNSKTMIIANVSPSICCAAETLNTLKFAQRAKSIQNNAVVNEDSSGDVMALQHQIRLLKEELSLLRRQNVSRSLFFGSTTTNTLEVQTEAHSDGSHDMVKRRDDNSLVHENGGSVRMSTKQLKSLETTLAGALRREKMAETSIKKLEAEIEHLNRLVRQREEDTRSTKMMLRFREDKIQRIGLLLGKSTPADSFLQEENRALSEEIQLLQAKIDKNPELTRFALENIRLLDQIRRFQEFYVEGEKEILLAEVSNLRDQLLHFLDANSDWSKHPDFKIQSQDALRISKENNSLQEELKNTLTELEECRCNLSSCVEENAKLSREIQDLHTIISKLEAAPADEYGNVKAIKGSSGVQAVKLEGALARESVDHAEEIIKLQMDLDILRIILEEERSIRGKIEKEVMCLNRNLEHSRGQLHLISKQRDDANSELKESKSVVEALESQHILSIHEIEHLRKSNDCYLELVRKQELKIGTVKAKLCRIELKDSPPPDRREREDQAIGSKFKKMQDSLEKARRLNMLYKSDIAFKTSSDEAMDEVRRQAEAATVEVIVSMQNELEVLQQEIQDCQSRDMETNKQIKNLEAEVEELQGKLYSLTDDNKQLLGQLGEKGAELEMLSDEIELLTCELEEILINGNETLSDACDQVDLISCSFPQKRIWISEQVGRLIRTISEKESLIEELGRCLEDANNQRYDVECMLKSLRGAALVINEAHQRECDQKEKEILTLNSDMHKKTAIISGLEEKICKAERHISKASLCATVAFVVVNRLVQVNSNLMFESKQKDIHLIESDEVIQSLRKEVEKLQGSCNELRNKFSEAEQRACGMEQMLEDIQEGEFLRAREKLSELKMGITDIRSCMNMPVENKNCVKEDNSVVSLAAGMCSEEKELTKENSNYENHMECVKAREVVSGRNATVMLLKEEIESAFESLKEVQIEMAKLRNEKDELRMAKEQSKSSLKCLTAQLLNLETAMNNLEHQTKHRMEVANHKLETLELEFADVKILAAKEGAENSCILSKFEKAQDIIKESDVMINELVLSSEKLKLDLERQKQREMSLVNERNVLVNKVQDLDYISSQKDQKFENLEMQFESSLMETTEMVNEFEGIIGQLKEDSYKIFLSITHDFSHMKTLISETSAARSSLEDIWSEIIMKDCAVSVLHLCHMGILIETVTGMNAENSLLQHGLCESNSVLAGLREHNSKLLKELDMCRNLKGKMLSDIRNSFDRILRKEKQTNELDLKLSTFEQKISGLQFQEELMIERSNSMGSQLAILMKELDSSNGNLVATLSQQEKLLQDKDELLNSQAEHFLVNFCSKEIESFVLALSLEELSSSLEAAEGELFKWHAMFENLRKELFVSKVDKALREHHLVDIETEVVLLKAKMNEVQGNMKILLLDLNRSTLRVAQLDEANEFLMQERQVLTDVACSNDMLKHDLGEVNKSKGELLKQVQELTAENANLLADLRTKERALEISAIQLSFFDQENQKLQKQNFSLETSSCKLQDEVKTLKMENSSCLQELEVKEGKIKASQTRINSCEMENQTLQERVRSFGSCIANLQKDLEMNGCELKSLQHSHSLLMLELGSKDRDLQIYVDETSALKDENNILKNELKSFEDGALNISRLSIAKCIDLAESLNMKAGKAFDKVDREGFVIFDNFFRLMCEHVDRISKFTEEVDYLQLNVQELLMENENLHDELRRKEEVLKGLSFDLSLLQESVSSSRDQKDKIEEMMIHIVALEEKLAYKTCELDEAVAQKQMFEVQLQKKIDRISTLESDITEERESQKLLSSENFDLRAQVEDAIATKGSLEMEMVETRKVTESLDMEISDMGRALRQMNDTIELLQSTLNEITIERDHLQDEILYLKDKLETVNAEAKESEAKCIEAQEIAESRRIYADEREEEVKLLEKSVEELEHTVHVLENKVSIVQGEAERQRLQREELELELQAINQQMQNVLNVDADMKRQLYEKEKDLEEALRLIEVLQQDVANKTTEIKQSKAHISELTLHAEAQASEYKQKFKALEAMAEQVKPENQVSHATNSLSSKSSAKPRGSSSPFKCIGLGMAQQINSEKDEELAASRMRIEELESLVANLQKEKFAFSARFAAVESMTHDVIRDLLGVKLNVTNCASLLDNQQAQKIAELVQLNSSGCQLKDSEVTKLKQQLHEFIEERRGWIEEIERKQAELVAAQVLLEKHRRQEQLLKSENEMLKMDNINHTRKLLELEGEVKKLSGQQNLQQRIHHHAKIKEENNMLKTQTEELGLMLRRAEVNLLRAKDELAHYRASAGRTPYINFDEEERLNNLLKETEEDRVQLAQKLLGICTSVLRAAGVTKHVSDISPDVAEEALEQLKSKLTSLEGELQHLRLKNKIKKERNRLSEMMPQSSSPRSSWTDENCRSPLRLSQTPYLSPLDR